MRCGVAIEKNCKGDEEILEGSASPLNAFSIMQVPLAQFQFQGTFQQQTKHRNSIMY
jgi:hypothetical protein